MSLRRQEPLAGGPPYTPSTRLVDGGYTTIDTIGLTDRQLLEAMAEEMITHEELDALRQLDPRVDAQAAAAICGHTSRSCLILVGYP